MNIKERYDDICKAYVVLFCTKQDIDPDHHNIDNWGTINIGEYFFYMGDIRTDIDKNAPKGIIVEWYWQAIEDSSINYQSYVMGARFK